MATRPLSTTPFATWLNSELKRQELSVRGLAKRMASRNGFTGLELSQEVERHRRNLSRYRYDGIIPTEQNRVLVAEALGVSKDEMPSDDEDEEAASPLTADDFVSMLADFLREKKMQRAEGAVA